MVVARIDIAALAAPGELVRGSWDVDLVTAEGVRLGGTLLVSDRRLLFHARQDLSRRGDWFEILHVRRRFNPRCPPSLVRFALSEGDIWYLAIPRVEVTAVELVRGFLSRSVRLMVGGGELVISNANFNAKKIVAALG